MKSAFVKLTVITAICLLAAPRPLWSSPAAPASVIYFDLAIDEARQRLYGTNQTDGSIDVLSLTTLAVLSSVPVGAGPAGLDLDPNGDELAVALSSAGGIAFVDLNTLTVITTVVPAGTYGPNMPYDVLYGRPGRLYSTGNPGGSGLDYVHVFDTITKTEVGASSAIMRAAPGLVMTADHNTLYVSQTSFSPQKIYRFDITTDSPAQTAEGPHGPMTVYTFCLMDDGRLFTSTGQVWSADLSTLLTTLPASGYEIVCASTLNRVYLIAPGAIHAFDADTYASQYQLAYPAGPGPVRLNAAETRLYFSTDGGIRALSADTQPRAFLPLLQQPLPAIQGRVTENGIPVVGVPLELRFFDGGAWSTLTTFYTQPDGSYAFLGAPSLGLGQRYYVRYLNNAATPGRLWAWSTRVLTAYTAGSTVGLGQIDIADIPLTAPASGATVALPYTFHWTRRPATPSDSYEFNLFEPDDQDPYFFTNPPLGYVGGFTLNTLPPGFTTGTLYAWDMWVYSPDGGYGISYWARYVFFSNTGFVAHAPATSLSLDSIHPIDDLPPRPPPR